MLLPDPVLQKLNVLEAVEPALCWHLIPALAFPAHRAGHVVELEFVLEGMAGVVTAPRSEGCTAPVPASRRTVW